MLKKFRLPMLALGTVLALMSPASMSAREHHREWREHHHHYRVYVGPGYGYYGPYYGPHYRGHYDAWGYWHPY